MAKVKTLACLVTCLTKRPLRAMRAQQRTTDLNLFGFAYHNASEDLKISYRDKKGFPSVSVSENVMASENSS